MDIIEKLKKEKTKWENRIYGVGETRIDLMIEDVIRELQKYQSELEKKECKYIRQNDDWIVYQCSNCKMDWVFEEDEPKDSEFNYCPKCGAKITEVIELEEE